MKELADYIVLLKKVSEMRTDRVDEIQRETIRKQKKGYYFKRSIAKGERINKHDVEIGAPCLGLDTFEVNKLMGETIKKDVSQGEPVNKDIFF